MQGMDRHEKPGDGAAGPIHQQPHDQHQENAGQRAEHHIPLAGSDQVVESGHIAMRDIPGDRGFEPVLEVPRAVGVEVLALQQEPEADDV